MVTNSSLMISEKDTTGKLNFVLVDINKLKAKKEFKR